MFPFPIATPQGCNIQTFYGPGVSATTKTNFFTWNKPVGVSHVYTMLIGAGGDGSGGFGGGSGAVTVWYGAAQHVPSNLQVVAGRNGDQSLVYMYSSASGGRSLLLQANGGTNVGGTATTAGPFAASGFYKSIAGQDGSSSSVTASTTTFLSGGADSAGTITANYGYTNPNSVDGYFLLQPIIVGVGSSNTSSGGIGCGGGVTGKGGPGMVLIASW